jgi:hypothetical protein
MQINCFKRLFRIWNAWREAENPEYDIGARLDEIKWGKIVDSRQTFNENLYDLKNNYPEYSWSKTDNPIKKDKEHSEEQVREMIEQAEKNRQQHEEVYALEQQQDVSVPEDLEEPETPVGEWKIEQSEGVETRTIELEIKPHKVNTKGKNYEFGRIQLLVDKNLVGCPVKISIKVLKI